MFPILQSFTHCEQFGFRQQIPDPLAYYFLNDGEGFDLRNADFGGHYYPGRSGRGVAKFAAATYFWLCGEPLPRMLGGQAWPASGGTGLNLPGADGEEGYSVADTGAGEPAERGETLSGRLAAVLRELGLSEACAGLHGVGRVLILRRYVAAELPWTQAVIAQLIRA